MRRRPAATALLASALASCVGGPPAVIRSEIDATERGKATIVAFVDFECPYCRRAHASLEQALSGRADRTRLVLRHVPLRMHPLARPAARVAVCAEGLGVPTRRIAEALYRATELGESAIAHAGDELGLPREALDRCVADAKTDARIERDGAAFDAVGGDGVPLLFVGERRFDGAQPPGELRAALDAALAGH